MLVTEILQARRGSSRTPYCLTSYRPSAQPLRKRREAHVHFHPFVSKIFRITINVSLSYLSFIYPAKGAELAEGRLKSVGVRVGFRSTRGNID